MPASSQAFEASRGSFFRFDPCVLVIIGIDTDDGPDHPLFDERVREREDSPSLQALAKNIAYHGIIEPVIIRKDGGVAQVIAGRRRVRAARIANVLLADQGKALVEVPCIIRKGEDEDLMGVAVSENEVREPDAFLARARKAARLINSGRSISKVAVDFGVQEPAVRRWLAVLDLDEVILAAIREGRIAPYSALELVELPRDQQVSTFEKLMEDLDKLEASRPRIEGVTPPDVMPEGDDMFMTFAEPVDGPVGSEGGGDEQVSPEVSPEVVPTSPKKKPTRTQVRAAVQGAKTALRPKKRSVQLLRKIAVAATSEQAPKLHPQALAILRWAIGEATDEEVENLAAVMALAEAE